jgi:PTH1 family peptidyl-tRNA hydrolase
MPILVGLGNPGVQYEKTRHNVGFEVIDQLAHVLGVSLNDRSGPWHAGVANHRGTKIVLIKPTTFMNLSGQAVAKALQAFRMLPLECMVITDDLNLPVGKIRIRKSGSAGGHNGLTDIIDRVRSDEFPRMRLGVGNDFARGHQAEYVLSPFNQEQRIIIDEMIPKAVEACLCFCREGIDMSMNRYNRT